MAVSRDGCWYEHKKTLCSEELRPEWYTEVSMLNHAITSLTLSPCAQEMDIVAQKRAMLL